MEGIHPRLLGGAIKDWSHDTSKLIVRFHDLDGNILVGVITNVDIEDHLVGGKEIVVTTEEIPQ